MAAFTTSDDQEERDKTSAEPETRTMTAIGCPDKELLRQYALGTLLEERVTPLEEHFRSCTACESIMNSLDTLADPLVTALRKPVRTHYQEYFSDPNFVIAVRKALAMRPVPEACIADALQTRSRPDDVGG